MLEVFVIVFISIFGLSVTFNQIIYKYRDVLSKRFDFLFHCDFCTLFWFGAVLSQVAYWWLFLTGNTETLYLLVMPFITAGIASRF